MVRAYAIADYQEEKIITRKRFDLKRTDNSYKFRMNDGSRRSNMRERNKKLSCKNMHYERDFKFDN